MTYRIAVLVLLLSCLRVGFAEDAAFEQLERKFIDQIQPLLDEHCLGCHDAATKEAELDLSSYRSAAEVVKGYRAWAIVLDRVEAGDMPPEDASPLPPPERQLLINWIREMQAAEAKRNAGDPGPVLARRLSNAEFDYSIRDLTGVDIRPTKTFPVDPANEAGFDNSGESLTMSPALLSKYLTAAREVADHLVLVPSGIRFAPHPVVTATDRDKYCVNRIIEFYQRQPTDYADYFYAAWHYANTKRQGSETENDLIKQIAEAQTVSPRYLSTVLKALQEEQVSTGPLLTLQRMWQTLKLEDDESRVRSACESMRDFVLSSRKKFEPQLENLDAAGIHKGSQPFVLWKNDQYAAHRRKASFTFLETVDAASDEKVEGDRASDRDEHSNDRPEFSSEEDRLQYRTDCQKFCRVFPDAFYISERGRDYLGIPREKQEKGRLLSAGFHSMMGYYRDDKPLYDLVLSEDEQRELDQLWDELEVFADVPVRQYQGFLWFDRTDSRFMRDPEFDFARPEDRDSLTEPKIKRLAEVYLAKAARNGAEEIPLQAIRDYFEGMNRRIRSVEQTRQESESLHLKAIIELAGKAYRRPLSEDEKQALELYYHDLRNHDRLSHEEAVQDTFVAILLSPHFCYRVDLLSDSDEPRPLTDYELASRLSYFLWSSIPDDELLKLAADGQLRDRNKLIQQTRRMLQDPRIRGLATEFGGNWLGIRRFEEHNSVDRERFPSFDDELRSSMFEEPIRFFVAALQQDRPVLDFLFAEYTLVNQALAEHYGMDDLQLQKSSWKMVPRADRYERGGLLPMAVFLTKNAPGLRTSPVKRGYWVVKNLLGEHIPPPPPNVPELPQDESELGELTLSQVLAKHREHESCAGCHDRIDPLGLVFEGFGPIGEARELDLGGKSVQNEAVFPDGSQRAGIEGLLAYLRENRQQDFVENFQRKLLSFALGRSLQLSDEPLLQDLSKHSDINQIRIGHSIEAIVTSRQFLNKRGRTGGALAHGEMHGL